jgi:hypothetical protein
VWDDTQVDHVRRQAATLGTTHDEPKGLPRQLEEAFKVLLRSITPHEENDGLVKRQT